MKKSKRVDAFGVKNGGVVYTVPEGKKNQVSKEYF